MERFFGGVDLVEHGDSRFSLGTDRGLTSSQIGPSLLDAHLEFIRHRRGIAGAIVMRHTQADRTDGR